MRYPLLASFALCALCLVTSCSKNSTPPTAPPGGGSVAKDRFLLVDWNSDLWRVDLLTGLTVAMTADSFVIEDYNATYTADGAHIVWQRFSSPGTGYDVWVMDSLGANKHLLQSGYLWQIGACSPTNRILYTRRSTGLTGEDVMLTDLSGSGPTQLTSDPDLKVQPEWSPAGDQISYLGGPRVSDAQPQPGDSTDIYLMQATGSGRAKLAVTTGTEVFACWSPDGTKLAFVRIDGSSYRLYVRAASGGSDQLIADVTWAGVHRFEHWAAWSPDGTRLFYRAATDGHLYAAPSTGGAGVDISAEGADGPCVSAGGSKLAYSTDAGTIVVCNLDGSAKRTVYGPRPERPVVESFR